MFLRLSAVAADIDRPGLLLGNTTAVHRDGMSYTTSEGQDNLTRASPVQNRMTRQSSRAKGQKEMRHQKELETS